MSDPYASNVILHMPLDSEGGIVYDHSPRRVSIDVQGNASFSNSVKKYGTHSMYLDGNLSYLSTESSPGIALGVESFTLEFWVNIPALTTFKQLVDMRPTTTTGNYINIGINASRYVNVHVNGADRIVSTSQFATSTWVHVAYVRNGGASTLYFNGVAQGSWVDSTSYLAGPFRFGYGAWPFPSEALTGYVDDLRLTKGVARYAAAFTPPDAIEYSNLTQSMTVLHLPMNNEALGQFIDVSPARNQVINSGGVTLNASIKKYGNASAKFASSNLKSASLGAIDFSRVDFCAETWVYLSNLPYVDYGHDILSKYNNVLGLRSWNIRAWRDSGGTRFFGIVSIDGVNQLSIVGPYGVLTNTFYHLALSRDAGVVRFFINGELIGAVSAPVIFNSHEPVSIGASRTSDTAIGSYNLDGYIDDVVITYGAAVYTSAFIPAERGYVYPYLNKNLLDVDNYLSAFPVPDVHLNCNTALTASNDIYYGGNGQIVGTTKNTPALPVARRVRLHETKSGHVIREDWSDAAGNYAFTHLSRDYTYYVVGTDHTGQYQGVVADKLVPEVMP